MKWIALATFAFAQAACASSTLDLPVSSPANAKAKSAPMPQSSHILDNDGATNPLGAESAAKSTSAVVYACPMHAEVTSHEPGKCPKCGMTLVLRKSEP